MPLDTPQQVDLSQDITKQGIINLSHDQQESFQAYLDSLQQEEKQGIIYLTQQELSELAGMLGEGSVDNNGFIDASLSDDDGLKAFIDTQKAEGMSTSDIIGANEIISEEDINALDTISQEILFGESGVFEGMNISLTAQDHISVALSLSIIEQLSNKDDLDADGIKELLSGNNVLVEELKTGLSSLSGTVSTFVNMEDDIDANFLDIAGNGERNAIFMQMDKGKDFFDSIFTEGLNAQQIEEKIESANLSEGEEFPEGMSDSLRLAVESGRENISEIQAHLQSAVEGLSGDQIDQIITETENGGEEPKGIMKWIIDLIKALLEGFIPEKENDEATDSSETTSSTNERDDETTSEQVAKTPSQQIRTFFSENADSGIFVGVNKESIAKLFPTEGELPQEAKNILARIEAIPGEESIEEKLNNLFTGKVAKVDGDTSQGEVTKIERFLLDMKEVTDTTIDIKNADGSLNSSALLRAVHAYSSYRIRNEAWKTESGNEDKQMPYSEFFKENIGSNEE